MYLKSEHKKLLKMYANVVVFMQYNVLQVRAVNMEITNKVGQSSALTVQVPAAGKGC